MNLSQQEWSDKLSTDDKAIVLDVRTPEEWNEGYIPGAIHIDIYKGQGFIDEVKALDKDRNYYIYCKAGGRSAQACQIMDQLGFGNTYNLLGGMMEWKGKTATD